MSQIIANEFSMKLVKCRVCGNRNSPRALTCPKCGHRGDGSNSKRRVEKGTDQKDKVEANEQAKSSFLPIVATWIIIFSIATIYFPDSYFSLRTLSVETGMKTTGCIEGNCSDGTGTYKYTNGSKYEGEFRNTKRHGQGTMYYKDNGKYVGAYSNGQKHGQGTEYFASGLTYTGNWDNGKLVDSTVTSSTTATSSPVSSPVPTTSQRSETKKVSATKVGQPPNNSPSIWNSPPFTTPRTSSGKFRSWIPRAQAREIIKVLAGTVVPKGPAPLSYYDEHWYERINAAGTTSAYCKGKKYERGRNQLYLSLGTDNTVTGRKVGFDCTRSWDTKIEGRYTKDRLYLMHTGKETIIYEYRVRDNFKVLQLIDDIYNTSRKGVGRKKRYRNFSGTTSARGRTYFTSYYQSNSSLAGNVLATHIRNNPGKQTYNAYSVFGQLVQGVAGAATQVARTSNTQRTTTSSNTRTQASSPKSTGGQSSSSSTAAKTIYFHAICEGRRNASDQELMASNRNETYIALSPIYSTSPATSIAVQNSGRDKAFRSQVIRWANQKGYAAPFNCRSVIGRGLEHQSAAQAKVFRDRESRTLNAKYHVTVF